MYNGSDFSVTDLTFKYGSGSNLKNGNKKITIVYGIIGENCDCFLNYISFDEDITINKI